MNILHPQMVIIGARRYRRNNNFGTKDVENQLIAPYMEETDDMFDNHKTDQTYEDEPNCGEQNVDFKGIEKSGNAFKLTMVVHESYFGHIIGRNAEKKMKLESDTKTKIQIPKRGHDNDWLVIEGKSRANIVSCRNRVNLLIIEARHRQPFTHLITFPLTFDALKLEFNKFQFDVLARCMDDRGVDDTIFQFPNKIHMTICTAVLLNGSELKEAEELLDECCNGLIRDLLGEKPLRVNIKGLEYMNDDPSQVDVLYAKVTQVNKENSIQLIADDLMNKFCAAGLTKRQYDGVKLHATVMNTLKRQDNNCDATNVRDGKAKERESFDARQILKEFGDWDFGCYDLREIHVSVRYSAAANGYYDCASKIKF